MWVCDHLCASESILLIPYQAISMDSGVSGGGSGGSFRFLFTCGPHLFESWIIVPQVHNSKVDELGLAAEGGPAEGMPQMRTTHWHAVLDRAAARPADMLPSDDRVRLRFTTCV